LARDGIITLLALMILKPLSSLILSALGITKITSVFSFTSDFVRPRQAVPSPPEMWGGNSQPNIRTVIFYIPPYSNLSPVPCLSYDQNHSGQGYLFDWPVVDTNDQNHVQEAMNIMFLSGFRS
jgi:hypothetical protein